MNTCGLTDMTFRTYLPFCAVGIERTWNYWKNQFDQQGDALRNPMARYFEAIGPEPDVFAVAGSYVYYHDQEQGFKFKTAFDIVFDTMEISKLVINFFC
jgi:hypothetical protein